MRLAVVDLLNNFKRFGVDEAGATAIEYSLVAASISIAIIVVVGQVGDSLVDNYYGRVLEAFQTANGTGGSN